MGKFNSVACNFYHETILFMILTHLEAITGIITDPAMHYFHIDPCGGQ